MKRCLLLNLLILICTYPLFAQPNVKGAPLVPLTDSIHKNLPKQISQSESKKIIDNQAFSLQSLFEANSYGSSGPRLNPRAVSFVQNYIEKNNTDLTKMKEWARPFFNMMDGVFLQSKLPIELKYLAVIESRLNPVSISWAGAVGPWQFMPATAIRMGLKVNRYLDERKNYIKSTHAAAKYLNELYNQFGDWLLVIAAYNGGPGNVLKAIRKSGSRNFWDIQYYLPTESRNHVKKFIGTHYIFEGQGGLTTLTRAESNDHYGSKGVLEINRNLNETEAAGVKGQSVTGRYHSVIIAKHTLMDLADFNRYNPHFDKVMASADNVYELKLPSDKMELFNAHKYQILSESISLLLSNAASISSNAPSSNEFPSTGKAFHQKR